MCIRGLLILVLPVHRAVYSLRSWRRPDGARLAGWHLACTDCSASCTLPLRSLAWQIRRLPNIRPPLLPLFPHIPNGIIKEKKACSRPALPVSCPALLSGLATANPAPSRRHAPGAACSACSAFVSVSVSAAAARPSPAEQTHADSRGLPVAMGIAAAAHPSIKSPSFAHRRPSPSPAPKACRVCFHTSVPPVSMSIHVPVHAHLPIVVSRATDPSAAAVPVCPRAWFRNVRLAELWKKTRPSRRTEPALSFDAMERGGGASSYLCTFKIVIRSRVDSQRLVYTISSLVEPCLLVRLFFPIVCSSHHQKLHISTCRPSQITFRTHSPLTTLICQPLQPSAALSLAIVQLPALGQFLQPARPIAVFNATYRRCSPAAELQAHPSGDFSRIACRAPRKSRKTTALLRNG